MPFIANTDQQRKEMLNEIGLTMADLFGDVAEQFRECSRCQAHARMVFRMAPMMPPAVRRMSQRC